MWIQHTATMLPIWTRSQKGLARNCNMHEKVTKMVNWRQHKPQCDKNQVMVKNDEGSMKTRRLLILCWLHSWNIWLWRYHIKKTLDQQEMILPKMCEPWLPWIKQHGNPHFKLVLIWTSTMQRSGRTSNMRWSTRLIVTIVSKERENKASICILSSMSTCRKALGMSDIIMYLPYFASIAHDNVIAPNGTVGELALSFVVYSCWGLLSAHPRAFIELSHFCFRHMRYISALFAPRMTCMFCL